MKPPLCDTKLWRRLYITLLLIDFIVCLTDVFETPEREHNILASNTDIITNGKSTIIKKIKNNKVNLFISDGKKDKPITHEVFYFDTDHDFDDDYKKGVPRSQIPKKDLKIHKNSNNKKKKSHHPDPVVRAREYVPMSSDLSSAEQYAENLDSNYNLQDMNDNRGDIDGGGSMSQGLEAVSSDATNGESDDIQYNTDDTDSERESNPKKKKIKNKEGKEHFVVGDDTMEDINEISAADTDDDEESFDSEDDNDDEKEQNGESNNNNNDNNDDQEEPENNGDKDMEEEEENYEYEDEQLDNNNNNNNMKNKNYNSNSNNDDNDEALDEDSVNENGNSGDVQNQNERSYENENADEDDDNNEEDRDNPSGSERNEVLGLDSAGHTRNKDNQNENQNENQNSEEGMGMTVNGGMGGRIGGGMGGRMSGSTGGRMGGSMGGRIGGGQIAGQIGGRIGGGMAGKAGGNVNVNMAGGARLGGIAGRIGRVGAKMVRIGGRLIRLKGGHQAPRVKLKLSISLQNWDWRRYIMGFKFESVSKASIGFLIDGMVGQHIKMIQRWVYNLALMFKRGSYLSFGSYGTNLDLVNDFQTFSSAADIRSKCQELKPSMGRKTGEALGEYYKLYEKVKKTANLNMILFLFLKGNTQGEKSKLTEYGSKLKTLGVKIFIFALGSGASMNEMELITNRQRIFQAANYKAVVLGGTGLKVGGREGMRTPVFNLLQKRFSRWLGVQVGIASMHATHHHGHSHQEWWFKLWGWYSYLGLQYGSIGKTNLAFVIDGTNAEMIMFIQRYVYNLIRLFQLQGTYVTIMTYGRDQYRIARWASFVSPQEIQKYCSSIPFIQTKTRNTYAALEAMYDLFTAQRTKIPNPNLLFLIMTGPSSDKEKLLNIAAMYRKLDIRIWAIGAGPEAKTTIAEEITSVAYSAQYSSVGAMTDLVQKPVFGLLTKQMVAVAGQGNVMAMTQGNAVMLRVQALWNWKSGMKSIKYGYLSRANIGFLIDGVNPNNFGYTRRMVYNLIRMYSLSGTYVTIMVYGSKVYRVANFAQFRGAADIKKACTAMPKVANGVRKTGAALATMLNAFSKAPPGNPMILYVLTHGPSSDPVEMPASQLRQFGIKVFAVGLGASASPKDLSTMAFSSTLIYKSSTNGMVNTMANIQGACASIAGTVSKACGPSGHVSCRKSDIVKNWQWKTQGIPFTYSVVNRASIGFLIDGTNSHHFDVLQKLVYNIYKLFGDGTAASIVTYGGDVYREMSMFRQYTDATALQAAFSSICYKGIPGRKTGAALTSYEQEFNKAPGGKKLLFLLTTGKSDDDVAQAAKDLVNKGVSIFALGIGDKADSEEIKKISRYYLTTKWRRLLTSMVKMQNSLVKVCGRNSAAQPDTGPLPSAPPGPPQVKPPMSPPSGAFIASSASQPIGHLQTNWNWYNMMTGIKPAGLSASNIVLLLDVTKAEHMDVMTRFISNVVRLFEPASEVTLIAYGSKPKTLFSNKVFATEDELKDTLKEVKPQEGKICNTGKALMEVKKTVLSRLKDSQRKGVCFVITRSKSSDDISKGAEQLKGAGLVLAGVGVGADYSQEELSIIATNGQLAMSGSAGDMVVFLSRSMFALNMVVNGLPKTSTISLTSMGGKNGGTLVASIMNTVQTSSIAGETAGQKGTPNTGAEAGDAQGVDTGKGSAGAPEQGGPTTPSGEGGSDGPAPGAKTPGGAVTGGGPTGAGGSDVAAGGGVAGATDAASGSSAQDGGKGGSADGGATGGPSAGTVTATGGAAPEGPSEAASNADNAESPTGGAGGEVGADGAPGGKAANGADAAGGANGETGVEGQMGETPKGPNGGNAEGGKDAAAGVDGNAVGGVNGAGGGVDGAAGDGATGAAGLAGDGGKGEGGELGATGNGKLSDAGGGIGGNIKGGASGDIKGGAGGKIGEGGTDGAASGGVKGAAAGEADGAAAGGADGAAAGGADGAAAGGIEGAAAGGIEGAAAGGADGAAAGGADGAAAGGADGAAGEADGAAAGGADGAAAGGADGAAAGGVDGAAAGGVDGAAAGGADDTAAGGVDGAAAGGIKGAAAGGIKGAAAGGVKGAAAGGGKGAAAGGNKGTAAGGVDGAAAGGADDALAGGAEGAAAGGADGAAAGGADGAAAGGADSAAAGGADGAAAGGADGKLAGGVKGVAPSGADDTAAGGVEGALAGGAGAGGVEGAASGGVKGAAAGGTDDTAAGGLEGAAAGGVDGKAAGGLDGAPAGGADGAAASGIKGAAAGGVDGAAAGGIKGAATGGADDSAAGGADDAAAGGVDGAASGGVKGAAAGGTDGADDGAAAGGADGAAGGGANGAETDGADGKLAGGVKGAAASGADGAAAGGADGAAAGGVDGAEAGGADGKLAGGVKGAAAGGADGAAAVGADGAAAGGDDSAAAGGADGAAAGGADGKLAGGVEGVAPSGADGTAAGGADGAAAGGADDAAAGGLEGAAAGGVDGAAAGVADGKLAGGVKGAAAGGADGKLAGGVKGAAADGADGAAAGGADGTAAGGADSGAAGGTDGAAAGGADGAAAGGADGAIAGGADSVAAGGADGAAAGKVDSAAAGGTDGAAEGAVAGGADGTLAGGAAAGDGEGVAADGTEGSVGVDGTTGTGINGKKPGKGGKKVKDKGAAIAAIGGAGMIKEGGVVEGVKGGPSPSCGPIPVNTGNEDCSTPANGGAAATSPNGAVKPSAAGTVGGGLSAGGSVNGAIGAAEAATPADGTDTNAAGGVVGANGAATAEGAQPESTTAAGDGNIAGGATGGPGAGAAVADDGANGDDQAGATGTAAVGVNGVTGAAGVGGNGNTGADIAAAQKPGAVTGDTSVTGKPGLAGGIAGGAGTNGKVGPNAGGVANGGGGGKCCCVQKDCLTCNPNKDCGVNLCNPRLKTCILKQPIVKSFTTVDSANAIAGTDDKEINTIQKLLEDFYGEDSLKKKRRHHIALPETSGTDIERNALVEK